MGKGEGEWIVSSERAPLPPRAQAGQGNLLAG